MSRPLMQYGIGQLEEMFSRGKAEPAVLKQLESELQYRQVPRAVALLAEVQAAMYGAASVASPLIPAPQAPQTAIPAPQQLGLLANPAAGPTAVALPSVAVQRQPPAMASGASKPVAQPSMVIPVDDAYKLLKATPASTWESIEQTRRLLVQQAHPSRVATLSAEKRAQSRADAARTNAAYLRLSAVRCNR